MTTLLVSLPYARFDSGLVLPGPERQPGNRRGLPRGGRPPGPLLPFHLEFLPFLEDEPPAIRRGMGSAWLPAASSFSASTTWRPPCCLPPPRAPATRSPRGSSRWDCRPGICCWCRGALTSFLDRCFPARAAPRRSPHRGLLRLARASSPPPCSWPEGCANGSRGRPSSSAGRTSPGHPGRQVLNRFPWVDHVAFGECEATLLAFAAGMRGRSRPYAGDLAYPGGARGAWCAAGRSPDDLDEAPLPRYRLEVSRFPRAADPAPGIGPGIA